MTLEQIETKIAYSFKRKDLLTGAFAHPGRQGGDVSKLYERLEFLGDRVLGLAVATSLYHRYPLEEEGDLARRQATLCGKNQLLRVAEDWEIALLFDKLNFPNPSPNILADTVEAILGAIYLDSGLAAALEVVQQFWRDAFQEAGQLVDLKSQLQHWTQAHKLGLPQYTIIEREGPDHEPTFKVQVQVGVMTAEGSGATRKIAENCAALNLLSLVTESN